MVPSNGWANVWIARSSVSSQIFAGMDANKLQENSIMNVNEDWWNRLTFGISITASFRFLGTPYEVRNTPRFSNLDLNYIPSRGVFLRQAALRIIICYIALDVMTSQHTDHRLNTNKYFSMQQISIFRRLHEVSGTELLMRAPAVIGMRLIMISFQEVSYSLVAFLAVLLGLSEPKDWPPFYGSVLDAYSMRRFWKYVLYCMTRTLLFSPAAPKKILTTKLTTKQ